MDAAAGVPLLETSNVNSAQLECDCKNATIAIA